MADPDQTLTFLGWVRERIAGLATAQAGGRAHGVATVTLTGRRADGATTGSTVRSLPFLLAGPADVAGLQPGAIVRRYPAPGTIDHESDRCPYVEFSEASLPWRYTPAPKPAAGTGHLHPWVVLLVGREGSELTLVDGGVTIEPSIQLGAHALGSPASAFRFAHVQVDAQAHRTARVLCGRPLDPGTEYVAVLVPAFDEGGRPSFTGAAPVTVPTYDAWRFRTAVPAGSFEDLAARLRPGYAPATTGRAPLRYPRLVDASELEVRGALVATSSDGEDDEPLPDAIADDVAALRLPQRDPQGRPIVTLPRYGDAWDTNAPDGSNWGRSLNGDPRHRGVAGLGLEVGIRFQEELVTDALAHLGALAEARQRIRHAVLGLETSRSLWRRRIPSDPQQRLWLLGPALPRLATDQGTVNELVTADDRALPRGVFSAAARRSLRTGPARTALLQAAATPTAVLDATNRRPAEPPASVDGVPLERTVGVREFDLARRQVIADGRVNPAVLLAAANDLATRADTRVRELAGQVVVDLRRASGANRPVPWGRALTLLASADADVLAGGRDPTGQVQRVRQTMVGLREKFNQQADDADLTVLLSEIRPTTVDDPVVTEVELDRLATGVAAAFDPTGPRAPVLDRVRATVDGLDEDEPLAPAEPCVGLPRAVWADVERAFNEWLLPGVGAVPQDAVFSLETNPTFVDAFLCGLNMQLLAELRFRNIPVATACTPLRRFWGTVDTTSGNPRDDIRGLHAWTAPSPLGNATHRPGAASGRDLVVAIRGALFLRYPATIVYLQSAVHGGAVDFDQDPPAAAPRVLPGFQGRLGEDVAFFGFPGFAADDAATHWLVFEEPPAAYRFANDSGTAAATAAAWAAAAFAQPVRVLIRGDSLVPGGGGE
jgi:hypothetical protein